MDKNEKLYFDKVIKTYQEQYLKRIQKDLENLFKQSIDEAVYNQYSPSEYHRTNQLKNNIGVKFEGEVLFIYNDTDNMNYTSAVDNRNVTELIPFLINTTGHNDDSAINNMYHHYPARNFLELAKTMINNKYPELKVEIISDIPPIV